MGRLTLTENTIGTLIDNVFLDQMNQREIFRTANFKRPVWYVAHPVSQDVDPNSPTFGERGPQHFQKNIDNAKLWMAWLMENDRTRVYIAPWITEVELVNTGLLVTSYDEALNDDEEVVRRLNGIIMVGGAITTGMNRERVVNELQGNPEINWSCYRSPWTNKSYSSSMAAMLLRWI